MSLLSSPAILILAVSLVASLISASLGSLLFFWRYKARVVFSATAVSVITTYCVLFLWLGLMHEAYIFLQTWPATGWDGLGVAVCQLIVGAAGLTLGFLFMGVARLVEFLDKSQPAEPN